MNPRQKIVDDLIRDNLIEDIADFILVASALEHGESREYFLHLASLGRWPEAFRLIQEKLAGETGI